VVSKPVTRPALRRELRFPETASVSIGVMAPTLAMSVTGVAAAAALGRAAPLAFVVAALGVGLVAYGFVRLAGEFSHAGSVYAFVGNTLGPRFGFLAGWALLGTYLVFPPVSIMGVAIFGRAFLSATGLASDADWYPLALGAWAVIWLLASGGVRPTTRSVLVFEVVSVCLILVLMGVISWRLSAGTAPGGQRWSGAVFALPPGTGLSVLTLAATSGFLAFAGFESAGSLGEESLQPTRMIPRAIITAVAFGAVFYVACIVVQTLGFGTGAAGVSAFRHSQAPLGELARRYVGSPLAALLDLGAGCRARRGNRRGTHDVRVRPRRADRAPPRRGVRGDRRAAAGAGGGDAHRPRPAHRVPADWDPGAERVLLPGHDRDPVPAGHVHTHQRGRGPPPGPPLTGPARARGSRGGDRGFRAVPQRLAGTARAVPVPSLSSAGLASGRAGPGPHDP
jgi:hypothetical protein